MSVSTATNRAYLFLSWQNNHTKRSTFDRTDKDQLNAVITMSPLSWNEQGVKKSPYIPVWNRRLCG